MEKLPMPTGKIVIPTNLLKLIQNFLILLGVGLGGTALMVNRTMDPVPIPNTTILDKSEIKAKKCELNTFTVQIPTWTTKITIFAIDGVDKWTYKITGNSIDFVPKTFPIKFAVTAIKDNDIVKPEWVTVVEDVPAPGPPLPNPTDPFETALRTAWQSDFTPDKGQTRLKLIEMYQFLLTQVSATITYGDLAQKLNTKAQELGIVGKALTFQTTLNAELSKILPHSPSILVEPTVVTPAFIKAISIIQKLGV